MAQRFGGKFSPDGSPDNAPPPPDVANRFRGARVASSDMRHKLLFVAPVPLLIAGIGSLMGGRVFEAVAELGGFGILILSAWLLREGTRAQEAYDARKVAKRPAIPRKIFAAVLSALGVALAAWGGWGQPMIAALIYGLIAGAAHLFAFGIDPLTDKGMEGRSEFDTERVAQAVGKAEGLLTETLTAASRFGDRRLEGRVEQMAATVREVFRAVEEDPRDLTGARKFLSVYLKGARDATIKFADLYSKRKDPQARADYEALLADLEASFDAQRTRMMQDNRSDLDVEIEVLRDRLKREGVNAES